METTTTTTNRWVQLLLLVLVISAGNNKNAILVRKVLADSVTLEEAKLLRDEVREMFYHAFDGYMENAFPLDELKPLSCEGVDTLGGYALTLIDSLDMLALLGDKEQFTFSVEWIGKNLRFDIVSKNFFFPHCGLYIFGSQCGKFSYFRRF
uniref:alpha-1,2-Mannosidase n=1 Tax=Rhizophora mucronata TaxID=61149 RepID=A0A2P2KRJ9_RHIMU